MRAGGLKIESIAATFGEQFDGALESLARIESTGAGTVLPGHGEPWTRGVAEAVGLARRRGRG